jgi:plasmid replication initiation protein
MLNLFLYTRTRATPCYLNFTKKCYDPNLHNILKKALKNIFKRVLKEVKEGSVVERVLLADRHLDHPRERFGRIC